MRQRNAGAGFEVSVREWVCAAARSGCGFVWADGARGSRMLSTKEGFVEILEFTHFARIFKFNRTPKYQEDSHKTILKKEISHEIKVSVVMELV